MDTSLQDFSPTLELNNLKNISNLGLQADRSYD